MTCLISISPSSFDLAVFDPFTVVLNKVFTLFFFFFFLITFIGYNTSNDNTYINMEENKNNVQEVSFHPLVTQVSVAGCKSRQAPDFFQAFLSQLKVCVSNCDDLEISLLIFFFLNNEDL